MTENASDPDTRTVDERLRDDLDYYKDNGISFIDKMKENKYFQNPKILDQTVEYFKIDENGSQFQETVFDPHGYKPEDYIPNVE